MPQANPSGGANSERLENVTFPQARLDINDNFEALQTLNSGNSEPSTKAAFMQWLDTSSDPAVLKIRNAANSGWIELGTLSASDYATKGLTAIANGGTGATTAAAAIAALLPSQSGNSGKSLITNGSILSWAQLASSSHQSFTSSGTWNKPSIGTLVVALVWGGGGGGSKTYLCDSHPYTLYNCGGGGGGGGACAFYIAPMSSLSSSYSVTIGGGGSGGSGSYYASGSSGGNSSFGGLVTAYGGAPGLATSSYDETAGHGGGYWGVGSANLGGNRAFKSPIYGDDGITGYSFYAAGNSYFGGGGGGVNKNDTSGPGGKSFFGGGGGGGRSHNGGSSVVGGNGGNGGNTGNNGSAPGGGGGGGQGGDGGDGARGQVDVYVI